jgi:hypothetical protein
VDPDGATVAPFRLASARRAVLCLAALALARVVDPPALRLCLFHRLTGRPCPLCGLTRSILATAHGRWSEAVHWHPFGPLVVAALAATAVVCLIQAVRPDWRFPEVPSPWWRWTWPSIAIALAAFGIIRFFAGPWV